MRYIVIVLFALISSVASATTYYVATNGSDSNPGTITQPFATWQKGFNTAVAGDIVYIRGGVYYPSSTVHSGIYTGVFVSDHDGTSVNTIKIMNYPGEVPILDGANITEAGIHFGVWLQYCDYWEVTGLWVRNVKEYNNGANYSGSIQLNDCTHFLLDRCTVSNSGEGFEIGTGCDYITYKNCDAIDNADLINQGDYTNGFGGTLSAGMHVAHYGCRAWGNSDDGYDYAGSAGGYITWDNCWSFNNGNGPRGNGVGFKTGMATGAKEAGAQRILRNCLAFNNLSLGFDEAQDQSNYAAIEHNLFNCTSYHNGSDAFSFNYPSSTIDKIRNCISFQDAYLGTISAGNINDHNSWNGLTPTAADFVSLDASGATGPRGADGSLPVLTFLHLASGSRLIDAGTNVGLAFAGNAPDLGAYETNITKTILTATFVSASIGNSSPSVLDMTYDNSLASVIPATSAFTVMVNSVARPVNSVAISGTKVSLTLASAAATGDAVTIAYTKPATNPLQTSSGGESVSLSPQAVTNNISTTVAAAPMYVSSAVQDATPSSLDLTYNLSLSSTAPSPSAFTVLVNSVARSVNSVSVSGTKVTLNLASTVYKGDIVSVSYAVPASNPIQTLAGGIAANISGQIAINNVTKLASSGITITVYPNPVHSIVHVKLVYNSAQDASVSPEITRIYDMSGRLCLEVSLSPGTDYAKFPINLKSGIYTLNLYSGGQQMASQKIIVY